MSKCARISMMFPLLLLAACSTKPATIKFTETEIRVQGPSAGLLAPCPAPVLVPSKTNGDIVTNSIMRQGAWTECALRHCGLIEWYAAAAATGEVYPTCVELRGEVRDTATPGVD